MVQRRWWHAAICVVALVGCLVPSSVIAWRPAQGPPVEPTEVDSPPSVPPRVADPGRQRAPEPPEQAWGGMWEYGPSTPFQFTRFDAEYYPGNGRVYFMGGRLSDGTTDGSVWFYDPELGSYGDTGVDLMTPVSNYEMNLLQDAWGDWGFYIFCGRPEAGGTTPVVQIYYPDTNVAVQLDYYDDYPGAGSCTSALNAVYQNQVYLAGGFDSVVDPYNWAVTYRFNPQAPVGSKWTLLPTANLTIPRAYIMSAVVDGLIYAIGGAWYDPTSTLCGQQLCNEPIVEVLDPTASTPVWSDVAAADLPEPCSSSRAYGFDLGSPYVDPGGESMAGWIVSGCGGWPDEGNLVYAYNTVANSWEPFPSFVEALGRRDQAAALLPAGNGTGMPGMWVWGGRQDADANVLTTSEFYALQSGACSILLVDDDWDFGSTRGGGRPYYTSTLDLLGYPYALWDTELMGGGPSAGSMAPYDVVIWFTGYDWMDPISPTVDEPEMMAYLDNGGNLFLSSEDQHYAYGLTPLLAEYFGVISITDDVMLAGAVVGNPADPRFGGLGPYPMGRPDQWEVYWPAGPVPYDDQVYAAVAAYEPTLYSPEYEPNAARRETGVFKAIFLGYPFEWIPNVVDRAGLLEAVLHWFCGEPISGLTAHASAPTLLGDTTHFTASVTSGSDVLYDWAFGDDTTGSGALVSHTYADPGLYHAVVIAHNGISLLSRTVPVSVSVWVDASAIEGGLIVFTDVQGLPTIIEIPPGAVSRTTTIACTPRFELPFPPPAGLQWAHHAFDLYVYRTTEWQHAVYLPLVYRAVPAASGAAHTPDPAPLARGPGVDSPAGPPAAIELVFLRPITITVFYSDADVAGIDEASLRLFFWTGTSWVDAVNTCLPPTAYDRDLAANRLTVPVCHLSPWGMMGE